MSPKEEGTFYLNMAKKYKAEDGERTLSQFCREENISYNKMIHILRTESYRKENVQPYERQEPELVIAPLEVGRPSCDAETRKEAVRGDFLENVEIELGEGCVVRIGACGASSLGALIAEIRRQAC